MIILCVCQLFFETEQVPWLDKISFANIVKQACQVTYLAKPRQNWI